jgi:hypothetical protein
MVNDTRPILSDSGAARVYETSRVVNTTAVGRDTV